MPQQSPVSVHGVYNQPSEVASLSPDPGYYRFDSASHNNCYQATVDHTLAKVLLMCGRFALRCSSHQLVDQFLLTSSPDLSLKPRFNIAPTQTIMALRRSAGNSDRELACFHWGLIPSWAKDPAIGNRMINARSETITEKPSFPRSLQKSAMPGSYRWLLRMAKTRQSQTTLFFPPSRQPAICLRGIMGMLARPAIGKQQGDSDYPDDSGK